LGITARGIRLAIPGTSEGDLNLNLATFFVADRNGVVYRTAVDPDQKITGEDDLIIY
jgi:hypothetical protein